MWLKLDYSAIVNEKAVTTWAAEELLWLCLVSSQVPNRTIATW